MLEVVALIVGTATIILSPILFALAVYWWGADITRHFD